MRILNEISDRTDAATPGPWEVDRNYPFSSELVGIFATDTKNYVLKATDDLDYYPVTSGDAEFIAHARQDVPKLLAAIWVVQARHERELVLDSNKETEFLCAECRTAYPCNTRREMDKELEGE